VTKTWDVLHRERPTANTRRKAISGIPERAASLGGMTGNARANWWTRERPLKG
jgi:hypothetical protein